MAARRRRRKGKLRTWWRKAGMMDRILLLLGAFLLVFTVSMVIVFICCGSIPDTLVTAVFAICGAEGGIMGWIKNSKERVQSRKWELDDRKNFSEGEK